MNLKINKDFREFVEDELLPCLDIESNKFWRDLQALIARLTPVNWELLRFRDELQRKIDDYH